MSYYQPYIVTLVTTIIGILSILVIPCISRPLSLITLPGGATRCESARKRRQPAAVDEV